MVTETRFRKIYSALAFASMFFMASGFIVPMYVSWGLNISAFIIFAGVLVIMLGGYLLQALFSLIFRFERQSDDGAYESSVKYFKIGPALPVILVSLISIPIAMNPLKELYYYTTTHTSNVNVYYDPNSVLPHMWAVTAAFLLVFGAVIWFFPYQRFARLRMPLVCIPSLFAVSFFSMQVVNGSIISAICLFGYTVCTMVIMNQSNLERRTIAIEQISFMTGKARVYNLAMTLSLLIIYFVAAFVLLITLVGLSTIGKFLLALLLMATNTEDEEIIITQAELGRFVFGETIRERATYGTLFTMFLAVGAVVIIGLALRKTDFIKRFISALKRFIMSIIDFFFIYRDVREKDEEGFANYKDEERKRQKGKISLYTKKIAATKNYRDFIVKLNSFVKSSEKIEFAYATLHSRLVKEHSFVKPSDTPRTVAAKICDNPYYEGIENITSAFELVAYAGETPNESDAESAIKTLCALIRKHLE